jgi:hypothetical protein
MAIELHHLNTHGMMEQAGNVLDGVARLNTRFAFNKKCDFALYGNEVTHWMPLPSAPKEGK